MWGLPQKQNARRAYKIRLCGHLRRYKKIVKKTYIIFKNNIISLSREIVKLINQGIKVHQESKFTNDSKSNMCTNIVNKYIREKYQYNLSIEEMKFLNDNIENMSIN